ncbi:MAG: lateral flagellar hook-associated protein 2 [Roseateles depolymerans]|uniref:Flagellar hook-associated protein 2 n=1 Tax=Roseateles depolymerans TaxID=76731 RepID=A0A2W5DUT8_9BURK|nr:MAG: lateral flagellar hook-associated protein 2 [Roseateles depolymerans]
MSSTSLDPTTLAQQLATAYTQPTQTLLDTQTKAAQAQSTGLTSLQSALNAFKTALNALASKPGQSVTQYSATASESGYFTATTTSSAQPISTPLYVEQVATTHQIAYQDLPAVPAGPGSMSVSFGNGTNLSVDLASADTDGDGTLSQAEIARAINTSAAGQVTAMVVTVGGSTQLMLTSGSSGDGGKITSVTSTVAALNTVLTDPTKKKELVAAQDAIVWLGAQGTGTRLQQASNTVTAIAGVSITLTKAQTAGASPLTLTVARDDTATTAKLQNFIDAYNKLETSLDSLTAVSTNGSTAGAFANDSGVRALKDSLANLLRKDYGSSNLRTLGVSIDRAGQLSVDSSKLTKALTANSLALNDVLGSAALSAPSGLLGASSQLLDRWTNSTSGQIKQRQDSVQSQQKSIADRQTKLQAQYTSAYNRYLLQFTQLQQLQTQMSQTSSIFSSLS